MDEPPFHATHSRHFARPKLEKHQQSPVETAALNIILSTLNHTASQMDLDNLYSSMQQNGSGSIIPAPCALASPTSPWVISGLLPRHGTGMTLLGVLLQCLIILLSLLTLLLLFIPILPLITEWPAQWL
jgi:hypothetical protein